MHYYVAFGRRNQDEEEFFSTAHEVVYGLEFELKRFPRSTSRRDWRALEIGCGPGRLLRPMSAHFGEIHGVDVSDEMIRKARENLRAIPHAYAHHNSGSDLALFEDESFDFVYSYAVFQHIPSRDVVFSYLREARRVLKTGGLFWFQVNGLPPDGRAADTWSGVRFQAQEIREFANLHDFQMYTLEGIGTQYMWTSLRKRPAGWYRGLPHTAPPVESRVRRISNPHGTEPVVPCRGRFAVASLWMENLPAECGLNHLRVKIGDVYGQPNYIAAPLADGQQQINVLLPDNVPTGLIPVEVEWLGRPLAPQAILRAVPPGPLVPRMLSVTDATDLLSGTRIVSGSVKVTVEELTHPDEAGIFIDGEPAGPVIVHCAEPRAPRMELVIPLGERNTPGRHLLEIRIGRRRFPAVELEIAP
jgi:ubiquinone/menaquinone biosynthesis C-methylase UbiE